MNEFFTKKKCDRCNDSLSNGRIMSMYNNDCICLKCKDKETKLPDYKQILDADNEKIKKSYHL